MTRHFLYIGEVGGLGRPTCVNPRDPYNSLQSAIKGAKLRQEQSLSVGMRPQTYLVVVGHTVVATVEPEKAQ